MHLNSKISSLDPPRLHHGHLAENHQILELKYSPFFNRKSNFKSQLKFHLHWHYKHKNTRNLNSPKIISPTSHMESKLTLCLEVLYDIIPLSCVTLALSFQIKYKKISSHQPAVNIYSKYVQCLCQRCWGHVKKSIIYLKCCIWGWIAKKNQQCPLEPSSKVKTINVTTNSSITRKPCWVM